MKTFKTFLLRDAISVSMKQLLFSILFCLLSSFVVLLVISFQASNDVSLFFVFKQSLLNEVTLKTMAKFSFIMFLFISPALILSIFSLFLSSLREFIGFGDDKIIITLLKNLELFEIKLEKNGYSLEKHGFFSLKPRFMVTIPLEGKKSRPTPVSMEVFLMLQNRLSS